MCLNVLLLPLCLICQQEIEQLQLQLNEARQRLQHAEEVERLESPPLIDMDTTLSDVTSSGDNKVLCDSLIHSHKLLLAIKS
jgi:hypothetical protein